MSGIQSFESNRIFTVSTSQRCVPEAHAGCDRSLNLIPIAKIGIFEIYRSTSFLTQGSIVPHTDSFRGCESPPIGHPRNLPVLNAVLDDLLGDLYTSMHAPHS